MEKQKINSCRCTGLKRCPYYSPERCKRTTGRSVVNGRTVQFKLKNDYPMKAVHEELARRAEERADIDAVMTWAASRERQKKLIHYILRKAHMTAEDAGISLSGKLPDPYAVFAQVIERMDTEKVLNDAIQEADDRQTANK